MDGASIGVNALTLNGGSIAAAADGTVNTVLTHDAVAADATRKVDGGPAPPSISVDRQPFFTAEVAERIYEVDVPVSMTLPAAVGGDGVLSYALTPALPTGLAFAPKTLGLSGTPRGSSHADVHADGDGRRRRYRGVDVPHRGCAAGGVGRGRQRLGRSRGRVCGDAVRDRGRTGDAEVVDVMGGWFPRPAAEPQVAFGGQELRLCLAAGIGRGRHAAGVERGGRLAAGQERVRPAGRCDMSLLTLSEIGSPERTRPAMSSEPGEMFAESLGSLAGYEQGLHQVGLDHAHAADRAARSEHGLRMPVGFQCVSAREMLTRSRFETPLG